jgi:hypothetical protein
MPHQKRRKELNAHLVSWQTVGLALAIAGVLAWGVGFLVGVIVRVLFGT